MWFIYLFRAINDIKTIIIRTLLKYALDLKIRLVNVNKMS